MKKPLATDFYDIESLNNVYSLCNYIKHENHIDIYYLCDNDNEIFVNASNQPLTDETFVKSLYNRITQKNKGFNGSITVYNLKQETAVKHMARTFGVSDAYRVNDPSSYSNYGQMYRITCDTDAHYDNTKDPYFFSYNGDNYDMTSLALFFYDVFDISAGFVRFTPTTAKQMRIYNDDMFLPEFKDRMTYYLKVVWDERLKIWSAPDYKNPRNIIRQNMKMTGRYIDISCLNEKQMKVGLKKQLGMEGHQILESDKLKNNNNTIENFDQFMDLIAYNISDCIGLSKLFENKFYQGQFTLKKQLLDTYKELVYEKKDNEYAPDISPAKVRKDRLFIDTSSAKFATKVLCPYGHLSDIPCVSFMYPSKEKSEELGIPQINVLEETKKFFYEKFPQPEIRQQFDKIYNYYKAIEGKNFNESQNYYDDWYGKPEYQDPIKISDIPKSDSCMFYYNRDGSPSSCFINFSIGGIHGAEYNKALYDHDLTIYKKQCDDLAYVQAMYPDGTGLKKAKSITLPDGTEHKATEYLKAGSTLTSASYKTIKPVKLFKESKEGGTELDSKYCYTSYGCPIHEDFVSYYPNLLIMMSAFRNKGLGYDRYAEVFGEKQKYGKLMKDKKNYSDTERELFAVLREGTKLILNSASGAADATYESNIRMNNVIISMRLIGQMFTWRIGQAQTYEGASIISTNTDGLYSVFEEKKNNEILARESKVINIEIEPEKLYLISKDTNNRLELNDETGEIISASGGSLKCRKGPNPTAALSHPAIIDWALTEYLIMAAISPNEQRSMYMNFDNDLGMKILKSAVKKFSPTEFLRMFQNIISSSDGSIRYVFGVSDKEPSNAIILQHYNRVFIAKDNTPDTMHLYLATAKKLTPATKAKRLKNDERPIQHDEFALDVLKKNGVDIQSVSDEREASITKVTNISSEWYMKVYNGSLYNMSEQEQNDLISSIDYDKYLSLLENTFNHSWKNQPVE